MVGTVAEVRLNEVLAALSLACDVGNDFPLEKMPMFMSWVPGKSELAALRVRMREIHRTHAPYLAQPEEFASALDAVLTRGAAADTM